MKYEVRFPNLSIEKKFEKILSKIPQLNIRNEIMNGIEKLSENPRSFGTAPFLKLNPPIQFYHFVAQYRLRVGNYRILYDIDDEKKIVWVLALRIRSEKTYR